MATGGLSMKKLNETKKTTNTLPVWTAVYCITLDLQSHSMQRSGARSEAR